MSITTVPALLAAARGAGLALAPPAPSTELDPTGLDFLVLHARDAAGAPWIVRTPRRPDVVATARGEARALQLVRPHLPVAVPDWRVHTDDVIAYPRLPGEPAVLVEAGGPRWTIDPAAPPDAFVDSLARALAALQAIPIDAARAAGVPVRSIDDTRAACARAIEATRAALEPPAAAVARWRAWIDGPTWPAHLALVHGDLHPGHLLLDAGGAVTGILDWTEAHAGDPSGDLAMCLGCFGPALLERLVARFAHHGGVTWPRLAEHAAERWAFFPVLAAEWSLRTGNTAAIEHARRQLAASA